LLLLLFSVSPDDFIDLTFYYSFAFIYLGWNGGGGMPIAANKSDPGWAAGAATLSATGSGADVVNGTSAAAGSSLATDSGTGASVFTASAFGSSATATGDVIASLVVVAA